MDIITILMIIFFAFCDVLMIYFMTNNLCGFKASVALKKIRIIPAIIAFSALCILIPLLFSVTKYEVTIPLLLLILTWLFVEKKKVILSIEEFILLWFLLHIILHLLSLGFLIIARFLTTTETSTAMLMYILSTLIILILCQKIDFNKLFVYVLQKTIFKILCLLIAMIFFIISSTLNNIRDVLEHSLIALPFLLLTLVGLIHIIKVTHQNTTIIPEAYHDTKKLLMLLDIKAQEAIEIDQLKDMISESMNLMNLQLPNAIAATSHTEDSTFRKLIKRTIESVQMDKKSNAKIISNIQFAENYNGINHMTFTYMLALLLDHALDTLTKRPVFVDISSSEYNLFIQISHEYKFEKNLKHLESILIDSEATRSKIEKNFNLSKLKSILETHHGKSVITRERNLQEQVDYLSICLFFKREGDSLA